MKRSLLSLAGLFFISIVVAAPKLDTPGTWIGGRHEGAYLAQSSANENTFLSFVCDPNGAVYLSFIANGIDYTDDFTLLIDDSIDSSIHSIIAAKTLAVIYGNEKKVDLPTKNAQTVLGRCMTPEIKDGTPKSEYCKSNDRTTVEGRRFYASCFYSKWSLSDIYFWVKETGEDGQFFKGHPSFTKDAQYAKIKDDVKINITHQWLNKNKLKISLDRTTGRSSYLFEEQKQGTLLTTEHVIRQINQ